MQRDHPYGVTLEELIAYIDGEASPRVVAHVRACPVCGPTARGYVRAQGRLTDRLWRFDCPTPHTLGRYELGVLPREVRAAITAHLVVCPRCADELRQLQDFLAVEPALSAGGAVRGLRRVVATLLAPPPHGAYGGVRRDEARRAEMYQAGEMRIAIGVELGTPRRGDLTGVVWWEGDPLEALGHGAATLIGPGAQATERTTEIDDLGNFTVHVVISGTYRLEVTLGDHLAIIEGLRVDR